MNLQDFLTSTNVFAVVGVSSNPAKYGHKVFFDLLSAGYTVYGINPHLTVLEGHTIYPSLDAIPQKADVVVTVVPPRVTEEIVEQCVDLGIKKIWMQPGSESPTAISLCEENNIDCVHDMCIMVRRKSNS